MFDWVINMSLELPSLTIVLLDISQSFVSVFKGTVMQIEKALKNDRLCVSKVS